MTVKLEIKKILKDKLIFLSLLISFIFVILHIVISVYPKTKFLNLENNSMPLSLYNSWIGLDFSFNYIYTYYLILPFLVSLPFSGIYIGEFKNHKKSYDKIAIIKMISMVVVSFSIIIIPFTIDYFLTALLLPTLGPEVTTYTFPLTNNSMFGELFYTYPIIYIIGYVLLDCIFIAALNLLIIPLCKLINSTVLIITTPFIINVIVNYFLKNTEFSNLLPSLFLIPFQPVFNIRLETIIIELLSIFLLFFILTFLAEKKLKRNK